MSSEVCFQCMERSFAQAEERVARGVKGISALDAEVFGAVFVQPSLRLWELVWTVAYSIIVMARVVVGSVVVCSVVLHHAVVVLQSGRCCIVQLIAAVVAVRGRVPLHSVSSLRCPIHPVPLLPPLRGRVSHEVAVLRAPVVRATPGERQGVAVAVGALRGSVFPDPPGRLRVLREPAFVEFALGGDCEETAVIVLPLRCAFPVRPLGPPVHRLGPPAIGRRGTLSGR